VFWVISEYFNIRNTLPNSGTFLLGHSVYDISSLRVKYKSRIHYFLDTVPWIRTFNMFVVVQLQTNFHIAAIRRNVCTKVDRCGCNASYVVAATVRAK
jgi:hypothetical protein